MLKFNPKRHHAPAYYAAVLRVIVPAVVAGHSQSVIRALLEASGLKSPTNGDWTPASVAGILSRIRERKGPFYHAVLEAFFVGDILKSDASALLRSH